MNSQLRRKFILEKLAETDEINVRALAQQAGTSGITIRRDLAWLATQGFLQRTHGGAVRADTLPVARFDQKQERRAEQKASIGQFAASFVLDHDVIFMDCGSTVFAMCAHLRQRISLKIITNSLPVALAFLDCPHISLNLIGGELDAARQAVHGQMALEHIARYRARKAFLGVDGLSLASGLTAQSEKEAAMTQAMAGQSAETFLLCDSSKLERDSYLKFAPLALAQHILTDLQVPDEVLRRYVEAGVDLRRA